MNAASLLLHEGREYKKQTASERGFPADFGYTQNLLQFAGANFATINRPGEKFGRVFDANRGVTLTFPPSIRNDSSGS
jgi:hypothetical protein